MNRGSDPLSLFNPCIRTWFTETLGPPTPSQSLAWPAIASGKHVLVTAPTGSGKTLTAFLWALDRLLTGHWESGTTRVLYISPLKALNNDVRKNLIDPLVAISGVFAREGLHANPVYVLTRSGDTPADERRRMQRRPPEILITTPESLNILLTSESWLRHLSGIRTVILDEVHALLGSRRGTHLMTAVERLALCAGEFQRIALSATVKPLETAAEFIGGSRLVGSTPPFHHEKRMVNIIQAPASKAYVLEVRRPEDVPTEGSEPVAESNTWSRLAASCTRIIKSHRSSLFFTNSRRTAEKTVRFINDMAGGELAWAHHGSLSREIRLAVEQKLKAGELRSIVATSSLELGIDIGSLDAVGLIQTPFSVSSALQRIGRSGHGVNETSRGLIFPTHGMDYVNAAVMARSVLEGDIEPLRIPECPLDVLAQTILSMAATEERDIEWLYAFITSCYPYRSLPRRHFDLVIDMLSGRYADAKIRDLEPRLSVDKVRGTVRSRDSARYLIYSSGGTIPDRGYYTLRVQGSGSRIGELDEEFVWERNVGDTFALGTQVWQIQRVTHNDVEVSPAKAAPGIIPFWRAEERHRDFYLSERIALFLERADAMLDGGSFIEELRTVYHMDAPAAEELAGFLHRQREATRTPLPHRRNLVVEHFDDPFDASGRKQVILHTLWGGMLNVPFSMALAAAWESKFGYRLEVMSNNECILLMLPHRFRAADLFGMVTPENLLQLISDRLDSTGLFGAMFRENAGRALLLPRGGFRRRLPLWLNRLRSQKLFDAVRGYADFPIVIETWRTCLQEEFDLEHLGQVLEEIRSGYITVSETTTPVASPFADNIIWKQTNTYMYIDDTSLSEKKSGIARTLIEEVALTPHLRPRVPDAVIMKFNQVLARTAPGYAPVTADELLDWVKERILIPSDEWDALLAAIIRDSGSAPSWKSDTQGSDALFSLLNPISDRIVSIFPPGSEHASICALDYVMRIADSLNITIEELHCTTLSGFQDKQDLINSTISRLRALPPPINSEYYPEKLVLEWLHSYGPIPADRIKGTFGISDHDLKDIIDSLTESQSVVLDTFRMDTDIIEICERENLERLLRLARRDRQAVFTTLEIESLPLFLASWQGLVSRGVNIEDLQKSMDRLFGFPSNAGAWEEYILPARMESYRCSWMDSLFQSSGLIWLGCGNKKLLFTFEEDSELYPNDDALQEEAFAQINRIFPEGRGRYGFFDLVNHSGFSSAETTALLWEMAWHGRAVNDTYASVRNGLLTKFAPYRPGSDSRRPSRSGFNRWTGSRPVTGTWRIINRTAGRDPLEEEELSRDRVRQLFLRYGIIFREIVTGELPMLQWKSVFRTLRLMELSGEILSGHFFSDIPGPQFASHDALRTLTRPLEDDAVFWLNAADPASLCGTSIQPVKQHLPQRISSNFLVYHGKRPVLTVRKNGSHLDYRIPHDSPHIGSYLRIFTDLLSREFNPPRSILVESINGEPALTSPYAGAMRDFGFANSYKGLELRKKY